eukprot:194425-Amphidinium_carterae.1
MPKDTSEYPGKHDPQQALTSWFQQAMSLHCSAIGLFSVQTLIIMWHVGDKRRHFEWNLGVELRLTNEASFCSKGNEMIS